MGSHTGRCGLRCRQHPVALLMVAVLLFALVNLFVPLVLNTIHATPEQNLGLFLGILVLIVVPALVIVVMYPIVGVPVAKSRFPQPLSRQAIKKQALWAFLFLPSLTILTEVGVIFLARLADPLTTVSTLGRGVAYLQELIPSYAFGILIYTTTIAAVLGVWCAIALCWIVQTSARRIAQQRWRDE